MAKNLHILTSFTISLLDLIQAGDKVFCKISWGICASLFACVLNSLPHGAMGWPVIGDCDVS